MAWAVPSVDPMPRHVGLVLMVAAENVDLPALGGKAGIFD